MANNQFIDVSQLDVGSYKASLIASLKNNPVLKDFNFDGPNISVLLDVLSRNTYMNAFYLNMVGSETFLDTATLKEPVVSRAKELNYLPRSRTSATAVVNITMSTSNAAVSTITIPKGFYFSCASGNQTLLFSTNETIVVRNESGTFSVANVNLYEGRLVTEYFTANSTQSYNIASANVDVSSISVVIQNSMADTGTRNFTRAYNLFGVDSNTQCFFVEGYKDNYYRIAFGTGSAGVEPDDGNIVIVTYRETLGADGNGYSAFQKVNAIQDINGNVFSSITASTVIAASGGAERESIDSIKFNAPRHFASQDRAVTKNDFAVMLKENFPTIQAISVFGGEELLQKQYGKVIIATKPYSQEITPTNLKQQMATFLQERMSVTMDAIFTDPDYFYVDISSNITFDTTVTTSTTSDIESAARAAIDNFNTTYLFNFNEDLRYSKLCSSIDNADPSIVGNDTNVRMIKRMTPIPGFAYIGSVSYGNVLKTYNVAVQRNVMNTPVVESDFFGFLNPDGSVSEGKIIDDGLGSLMIISDSFTLLQQSVGTVDYSTGTVTFSNWIVNNYSGHINLYAVLENKDIVVNSSQILQIDEADVTITVLQATQ